MTAALLRGERVDVGYGRRQVLHAVDVDVGANDIVALLGTNGAGKSTLLKAISGLVRPTSGRITFDGVDITNADGTQTAELGIVHVPGGDAVFPDLTIAEHFTAAGWLHSRQAPHDGQLRVDDAVDQFPWLRARWLQRAGTLSSGEQQQLALAMALASRPRLLIVDELSLGLSPRVVAELIETLRRIHADGCAVLFVEQSLDVALRVATRAYFLEKGQVRFSGPAAALAERTDLVRSLFLAGAATNRKARPAATTIDDADTPALRARGLVRSFGGNLAVDHVDLTLHRGRIVGLIGPNGAGKTTVLDLVSGHLPLDGGRIRLGHRDITRWPAHRRAAAGLGRSFQHALLFPSLTVAENIAVGRERHVAVRSHLAALLGLPAAHRAERDTFGTVDQLVELMQLGSYRDALAGELSTGTRRVAELAVLLAHEPTTLLLDEPSAGLAHGECEALAPLLLRMREQTGCALLIVEHDLTLARAVCDELIALDLGAVIAHGSPDDVLADPRVVTSYLGRSGDARP